VSADVLFAIRTRFVRPAHHTYRATADNNTWRYRIKANHQDAQRINVIAQRIWGEWFSGISITVKNSWSEIESLQGERVICWEV